MLQRHSHNVFIYLDFDRHAIHWSTVAWRLKRINKEWEALSWLPV